MDYLSLILLVIFCLQIATAKSALLTTIRTTQKVIATTEPEIVYDYSEMINETNVVPVLGNVVASTTTPPVTINPRVRINETINNIAAFIPELQSEISGVSKINFGGCSGNTCNDVCTRLNIEQLALDTYGNLVSIFKLIQL